MIKEDEHKIDQNVGKALVIITNVIKEYRCANGMNGDNLNKWLKELTGILFYLETERSKYHDAFQKKIFELCSAGDTVSRAENKAHVATPELYMLRHIMSSAYRVADAMRTNISFLKSERNHTPNQT